jgi:lipopolysaccharide transport system ATP-binding protein
LSIRSDAPAIEVRGLGKRYVLGETTRYPTLRARMEERLRGLGGSTAGREEIWALRDVTFDVRRGEVIGVVGRNGSGKSTLLKILARIVTPTEGRGVIRGRVAALLEVGVGFHPELSGRENVFMSGALLGLSRAEIDERFDAIVRFSEVDRFIDVPVKRYSSGMLVRLAFSVAVHVAPEILLLDEVLNVGDVAFQRKSLERMEGLIRGGRTVFLVSHDPGTVERYCTRAVWLREGRVAADGPPKEVVREYLGWIGAVEKPI